MRSLGWWTLVTGAGTLLAGCSSGNPATADSGACDSCVGSSGSVDGAGPQGDATGRSGSPDASTGADATQPQGDGSSGGDGSVEGGGPGVDGASSSNDANGTDAPASGVGGDAGSICSTPGCPAGQTPCGGKCVSLQDPQYGCGSCSPCDLPSARATCGANGCAVAACDPGWADCDGNAANGCEAELLSPNTCGSCSVQCAAPNTLCSPTGCVQACAPPLTQCTDRCANLATSAAHCGACDNALCGAKSPGKAAPSCSGGSCGPDACYPGFTSCGGGCTDLMSDPANCGSCGHGCPAVTNAAATCVAGACAPQCPPGWTLCGSACVTTRTDGANCGACGRACAGDQTCAASSCVPTSSLWIATGVSAVHAMAVDSTHVYWTDGSAAVQAVPTTGGTVQTLAQGQGKPLGIALDSTYVYWSNNLGGAIMRTRKDGTGTPSVVSTASQPGDIGILGDNLYWIDQSPSVWKVPTDGSSAAVVAKSLPNAQGGSSSANLENLNAGSADVFVLQLASQPNAIHALLGGWSVNVGPDPRGFAVSGATLYYHVSQPFGAPCSGYQELQWTDGTDAGSFSASDMTYCPTAFEGANSCGLFFSDTPGNTIVLHNGILSVAVDPQFHGPSADAGASLASWAFDATSMYFYLDGAIAKLPLP